MSTSEDFGALRDPGANPQQIPKDEWTLTSVYSQEEE